MKDRSRASGVAFLPSGFTVTGFSWSFSAVPHRIRPTPRPSCVEPPGQSLASWAKDRLVDSLTSPGSVRHFPLRNRQRRRDSVQKADVEQHALRHLASHALGHEIDDEESLPTHDLLRSLAFLLHAGQNRPPVVAEVDREL